MGPSSDIHAAGNSSHPHHHKKASNADDIEKAFRDLFKQNTHEFNILLNRARTHFKWEKKESKSRRNSIQHPEITEVFEKFRQIAINEMNLAMSFVMDNSKKTKKSKEMKVIDGNGEDCSNTHVNNVALMASTLLNDEIKNLMVQVHAQFPKKGRLAMMSNGSNAERDKLWEEIRSRTNELAPSTTNTHIQNYAELSCLRPSEGFFKDIKSYRSCFSEMKSKVTEVYMRSTASGHYETGEDLDLNIFENFITYERPLKEAIFYTWLEWKDDFTSEGWLNRLGHATSNTTTTDDEVNPSPNKKRKEFERLIEVLQQPIPLTQQETDFYEDSALERANNMIVTASANQELLTPECKDMLKEKFSENLMCVLGQKRKKNSSL